MTYKYDNVYVENTSTIVGPYENNGPLSGKFDKVYEDLYESETSFEKAEIKLMQDSVDILLKKIKKDKKDIDLFVAGDLQNQIISSCYTALKNDMPFLGIYSACATNIEGMIIASTLIDGKKINNAIVSTSSHNMVSEKQFRNPTEYGAPKPKTSTFTATGGTSILLTNEQTNIKVESSTIGKVIDMNQNDPLHMGACMVPGAADTIYRHLQDLKREPSYYDLILTGDLGLYGKQILIDYVKTEYGYDISKNYDDAGTILFDTREQKDVHAGGSGPVCSSLVTYADVLDKMKSGKLKRVLLVATGALFNPTIVFQKENVLAIAHAISLEVLK